MKNKLFKKAVVMFLAVTMLGTTVLSGCGKKDDSVASDGNVTKPEGEYAINVHVGPEPETIDPVKNTAVDGGTLINHAFEGLMKLDEEGNIVDGMAQSHTVSEDGLVYTFKIRDDAKWSDGADLTAEDFVYSWQRAVDPATASDYNYMIDMVANANEIMANEKDKSELGVKALDSKTFEVTLTVATPYFLEICAFPTTYPVREDIVSANPDTWSTDPATYIGNGPYVLKTWTHQSEMVYEKNPNYYDVEKLGPQKIVFKLIEDYNTILASFENGEILFGEDLPTADIDRMTGNGYYVEGQLGTYFLCLNVNDEVLKDVKVRKALSLAIDRQYVIDYVSKGGEQAADSFVATGLTDVDNEQEFHDVANKWYSVDPADYDKNVEEAQNLLAEAGYPNGEGFPTIEYMFNVSDTHQQIAEAITYMWKEKLGINSSISSQDWAVFIDTRDAGDYQIARHGWLADYNDPISFLDMWVTGGGNNDANYSNKEYDELIAKVKASSDRAERLGYMHQAEDILGKDMPIIPIYFYTDKYLKADKLKDVYTSPLGFKFFKYAYVEE